VAAVVVVLLELLFDHSLLEIVCLQAKFLLSNKHCPKKSRKFKVP